MQEEVAWQQKEVTVYGKTVMQPRLVAYMADDPALAYTYSRQTMIPDAWTPAVKYIKVSGSASQDFQGVVGCVQSLDARILYILYSEVCRACCRIDWSRRLALSSILAS